MLHFGDNIRDLERHLSDALLEQLPFATALALNDTAAQIVYDDLVEEMRSVFESPTRFTLQAFRFDRASKRRLVAVIKPKTRIGSRHYLFIQSDGGTRPQTGLERLFQHRLSYGGTIHAITPAPGMRLDARGNMSRGHLNQIIAGVQAQSDVRSNTTARSRSRNRGRAQYFVPRPGSRLSPGVWMRTANGGIRKVLHFTASMPSYQARFPFEEMVGRRTLQVFPGHLNRRLQQAWNSRRR